MTRSLSWAFKLGLALSIGGLTLLEETNLKAAETVKFGSALKGVPRYDLLVITGQERGFWKQFDLELEWVAFRGATDMHRALAAGGVDAGVGDTISAIQASAQGVPVLIVADLPGRESFHLWVLAQGPIRGPKDLKAGKIGTSRFAGAAYAYARFLAKNLGIDKEIKFVAVGGISERMAALKSGAIDGFVIGYSPVAELMVRGEIKSIGATGDFLPEYWSDHLLVARKDFIQKKPEVVRKVVKGANLVTDYILKNPQWTTEILKTRLGYSERAAVSVREMGGLYTHPVGKIDPKALQSVRNFVVEYGIIPREKALPVEELYSPDFTS